MYQVEKIVETRKNKGRKEYLIKWKGYDQSENTWQPQKNLKNVKQLIKDYNKSMKNKEGKQSKKDYLSLISQQIQVSKTQKIVNENIETEESTQTNKNKLLEQDKKKYKIKVIAMSETQNHQLVYKILINQKMKWVKRQFLVPEYLLELVQFYESNINFKD